MDPSGQQTVPGAHHGRAAQEDVLPSPESGVSAFSWQTVQSAASQRLTSHSHPHPASRESASPTHPGGALWERHQMLRAGAPLPLITIDGGMTGLRSSPKETGLPRRVQQGEDRLDQGADVRQSRVSRSPHWLLCIPSRC